MVSRMSGGEAPRPGRPSKSLDPSLSQAAFLGWRLRQVRLQRALTLSQLATRVGYSAQHIGAVERAEAAPSEAFISACDEALQTAGQFERLLPGVIREQSTRRHERVAQRRGVTRSTPPDRVASAVPDLDLERLAALGSQTSVPSRRVVDEDLARVTAGYRNLYHELTSAELQVPVAAHLKLLTTLLKKATDATSRPLASSVGETAGLAAWLYADLGDNARSQQMYRIADSALADAADWALSAYVYAFRASTLLERGNRSEGIAALDVAEAQTPRTAPGAMIAWISALRANALAAVGDHTAARAALSLATTALDRADSQARAEWMYDFDHARLAGYRASCFLWQRQAKPAITEIQSALAVLPSNCVRRRADLTLDLGYAQLIGGDIAEASASASVACGVFLAHGSVPGLRRVERFRARLLRGGHARPAAALEAQIHGTLTTA